MENIQQNQVSTTCEPLNNDNSNEVQNVSSNETSSNTVQIQQDGQSETSDPSKLILGKFKNVAELSKAYSELQKKQGQNSNELGDLRQNSSAMEELSNSLQQVLNLQEDLSKYLEEYKNKYNTPEYFQDNSFRTMYKEAFKALGKNLDTDKFIQLLEGYVGSRITNYEKAKSAKNETENVLGGLNYEKNPKSQIIPPKKKFDEMTQKEVDELLDKLI